MKEYNYEECLKKIKEDSVIVFRKMSFKSLLVAGFFETLSYDPFLKKAVEIAERKKPTEEISSEDCKNGKLLAPPEAMDFTLENDYTFYTIYIQALLDEIAPQETLILTSTKVKHPQCLSQAGQVFMKIARRRMAESKAILPSYSLWSQQIWRLKGSIYKYTTEEPRKLMDFLFEHFLEDIKMLLHELNIDNCI